MAGTIAYEIEGCEVPARGYTLSETDVEQIAPAVRAILRDEAGIRAAREALKDLITTGFAADALEEVLAAPASFAEWRVGEALAEHHLSTANQCVFPWPDSRSTRNPGSSSGGVDLIGFASGSRTRFVFAEVKTSHQQAWPPSVVTSRSDGLRGQLSGLSLSDARCRWAIKYLHMNSLGRDWFASFRLAMATYLANKNDVLIFGVLVHVAAPDSKDLKALTNGLAHLLSDGTELELVGLYIEPHLLERLADGLVVVETAT